MRIMKVLVLALLLWTSSIGFAEEALEVLDSETIVEGLLKGDGKTRGISVQPRIEDTSDKSVSKKAKVQELPASNVTKSSMVALNIRFHFDSAQLTKHAVKQLNELGKALTSNQLVDYRFEIAGHTDSVGDSRYNKRLSEQRANAVKQYLISYFELEPHALQARGYGEEQPLLENDSTHGVNRRVEIRAFGN